MDNANVGTRTVGTALAIGGLLFVVVFVLHGPLQPNLTDQMHAIEHRSDWAPVHWVATIALCLFAIAGLVALSAGSRLVGSVATTVAWALVAIGAVGTLITAITEATAITYAAGSGDQQLFESWWSLAEGFANGFALLALGVIVIAASEASSNESILPSWLSWIGVAASIGSLGGWALSSWMGLQSLSLVWVAASLLMCLWLAWFGFNLARNVSRSA